MAIIVCFKYMESHYVDGFEHLFPQKIINKEVKSNQKCLGLQYNTGAAQPWQL